MSISFMSNVKPQLTPSIASLRSDASKTASFFCEKEQADLPFVHRFPQSACEVVSAFLAVALQSKYARSTVMVTMAYDRPNDEWHFWVEVDGFVIDATAHQFPEHNHPLVCAVPSPLAACFPDIEHMTPIAALNRMSRINQERKRSVVTSLERKLLS